MLYISLQIKTKNMLHTSIGIGIGIARDHYYWILDIGCLAWYRSNANNIGFSYFHFQVILILTFL